MITTVLAEFQCVHKMCKYCIQKIENVGLTLTQNQLTTTKMLAKHVMHIIEIKNKGKLQRFKFGEREGGHSASRPRALFTCHIRLM